MTETNRPTIKGLFVNSHIEALRKAKGDEAVLELEKQWGKPIKFQSFQNVPVKDEVRIIELALQILKEGKIPPEDLEYEAGRFHFYNFSNTSYGKIILSQYKNKFRKAMLHATQIAGYVFRGVKFTSFDFGPKVLKVVMENADYPVDHFKGFFQEWMEHAGLKGEIKAKEVSRGKYEYLAMWE